jgi:hypothetical protein
MVIRRAMSTFKGCEGKPTEVSEARIREAIHSGLSYILNRKTNEGNWEDFRLPGLGTSDAWVTAYIGFSLSHLRSIISDKKLSQSLLTACDWLSGDVNPDFGWGYNDAAGTDADSTAYSILFLDSLGKDIDNRCFTCILNHQQQDGGFSTFVNLDKMDSWGCSHPDVTALALLALLVKFDHNNEMIRRGKKYVLMNRNIDGTWSSFWWETSLYGTWANMRFLHTIGERLDTDFLAKDIQRINQLNCFELSLLGESLVLSEHPSVKPLLKQTVANLVSFQASDGHWKGEPILRSTCNWSHRPWMEEDSGNLYADQNRLFISATVLRFLGNYIGNCLH